MKKLLGLGIAIGLMAGTAGADLLVGWDFNGYAGSEVQGTSTVAHANMESPAYITRGGGVGVTGNANRFNGNHWTETSLANAITANDYFSFTVNADPGYKFSVTNFTFNFERSSTGGQDWTLRSSADSFAADLATFTGLANGTSHAADLALTDLTGVEFRFYGYNGTGTAGSAGLEGSGNDLVLNGTVSVIPEPGTLALLGAGIVLLFNFRRRFAR